MGQSLTQQESAKAREAIMIHVRQVVPYALLSAVASGLYMISVVFGPIDDSLSSFQIILLIKATLGIWLGLRGFNQKFFKINPWLFKGHIFPLMLVVIIVILSQLMYY